MKRIIGLALTLLLPGACAAQQSAPAATGEVLTLERAVQLALDNNRGLRIAQLETRKAGDQIAQTRTRRLPQASLDVLASQLLTKVDFEFEAGAFGTYPATGPIPATNTKISSPRRPNLYVVGGVAQPLSQLYKIKLGIEQGEISRQMREEEERQQRHALVQRVRSLYYAALEAEATLAASREAIAFYREMDRLTSTLVAEQAALKSENLDVRARLAQEEYTVLTQEHRVTQIKEQLNVEMGREVSADFQFAPVGEATALESDLRAAHAQALERRPELRAARLKVRGAEQDRKIKRAEYIPDVSLAFNYLSPFSIDVLPKNVASVGLQLSWEPWDWGRRKRELDEKGRSIEQAELSARESESRVLLEVSQSQRKLRESRALISVARAAQESAQEKVRVARNRFAEQAVLLKDVLQAQNENAQAAKSYQQAILAYWNARAEFEKAIGEGQ